MKATMMGVLMAGAIVFALVVAVLSFGMAIGPHQESWLLRPLGLFGWAYFGMMATNGAYAIGQSEVSNRESTALRLVA